MNTSRRQAALATLAGSATNTLVISIQAVVLIPLYLRTIGPRLYGAWLGSGDILVWMYAFDLGLPNLITQRVGAAHGRGDLQTVAEYLATGMVALALVAFVLMVSGWAVSFPLAGLMDLDGGETSTLSLCFAVATTATALNVFNNSVVGFSRGIQKTTFMNGVVIISSLAGFGVSLGLVLQNWGLWAITLGLVARTGISLAGSIVFLIGVLKGELARFFRVRRSILREFLTISPATALGGIGYAVMNQSEAALVAILLRPELATVVTLTRKALQVARSLVDTIAFAAYGGFAHLVTSDQRHRTLQVYAEINSLRFSLAVVMASAYMAVNAGLVSLWVGGAQYGGALLTILMAIQFIVVGSSFLANYLYRATGSVMRGSLALFTESIFRVPLMAIFLLWLGPSGIPIACIITGGVFGLLMYRWTLREVMRFSKPLPIFSAYVWIGRGVILGIGILACLSLRLSVWSQVFVIGLAIVIIGGVILIYVDPLLNRTRVSLTALLTRRRVADEL